MDSWNTLWTKLTLWLMTMFVCDEHFVKQFDILLTAHYKTFYSMIPLHNGSMPSDFEWIPSQNVSITFFCPILILEKEPVFPFSMLSAKQRNYWYHFYNDFGMTRVMTGDWTRDLPHLKPALYHYAIEEAVIDWGLNPGPPTLEASTIPLGYRGGTSYLIHHCESFLINFPLAT